MRWVIAIGLIAACGRVGFEPLGDDGSATLDGPGAGGGSNTGSGSADTYYITSGEAWQPGSTTSITAMTGPLTDANMVLVVSIYWGNATSSVTTVQDMFGNGFSMVGSMTRYNAAQSQITYFKKLTAGTTINVVFDQATTLSDLKWAAYRNINQASPVTDMVGDGGTSSTADSGPLSLTGPAVLVATLGSRAPSAAAGAGYTPRIRSGSNVLEDRLAASGTVNATATLSSSNDWIIQVVALRPL